MNKCGASIHVDSPEKTIVHEITYKIVLADVIHNNTHYIHKTQPNLPDYQIHDNQRGVSGY